MIRLHLDRVSPVPLYHQIVQAIRWRIGTGALRTDDALPGIRDAAEAWNVNYHTVRRAYHELAREGWVESVQGAGTRVASALPPKTAAGRGLDRWLDEVLDIAVERFGLPASELARMIQARQGVSRVVMVECNTHQAETLARQLEEAWLVEAIPWDLRDGEPPQLPIIGTFFHHAEMKRKWPKRIHDMHFVAVRMDRGLRDRIEAVAGEGGARSIRLVEQDSVTAHEMAAAVAELLPDRFTIEPVVGDPQKLLHELAQGELMLVAPRLWDDLSDEVRSDPRVLDVAPTIVPEDLGRVWRSLNSTPAAPARRGGKGSTSPP